MNEIILLLGSCLHFLRIESSV